MTYAFKSSEALQSIIRSLHQFRLQIIKCIVLITRLPPSNNTVGGSVVLSDETDSNLTSLIYQLRNTCTLDTPVLINPKAYHNFYHLDKLIDHQQILYEYCVAFPLSLF